MQNHVKTRLAGVAVVLVLLTSAFYRTQSAPVMSGAAKAFLASLTPEQSAKAAFPFDSEERFNWHFIPKERKGLSLREMTGPQKALAHALLSAGLSQQGYIKATSIMSLEEILRILERDTAGNRRNAEGYFFSVFGEPKDPGTWGYRVEGHHLSLNFTVANGKVVGSPAFFGTNPAEVREGPRKGLRVLGEEEDKARELLTALSPEQKKVAILTKDAYKDIITAASRKASLEGQPTGLHVSKMNAKQRAQLLAVVEEYAHNMPEQLAQARLDQFKKAGNNMYFAWAGVEEKGGPHYYRVQAPEFMIEYDNTQGNANHVHSVWRDFNGDFGLDLLGQHYRTSHTAK